MAIATVTETAMGRQSFTGQHGRRIYRRNFIVTTTSAYTGERAVKTASDPATGVSIPAPWTPYTTATENDPGALVRAINAEQRSNTRLVWDVSVDYDNEFERRENPWTEPPDLSCDTEHYEEALPGRPAVFYDTSTSSPTSENPFDVSQFPQWVKPGAGWVTSAGELFNPPPMRQCARSIFTFTRNEPVFTAAYKAKYENTVNKTLWCGLQPRQAWVRSITAKLHLFKSTDTEIPNIAYWRVSYVFAVKPETWDTVLLDIGSYYLDYSTDPPTKREFRTADGSPRLGLLDHSVAAQPGKRLADGADAQYLRSRTFREEDLAPLGINLNLSPVDLAHRRR